MNTEKHKQHMTAKQRKMREIERAAGMPSIAPMRLLVPASVVLGVAVVLWWLIMGQACVGADKCGGVTCPEGTTPITVQADNGWTCICSVVPK